MIKKKPLTVRGKTIPNKVEISGIEGKPLRHSSRTKEKDDTVADKNKSFFKKRLKAIKKKARKTNYDERTRLLMYKGLLDLALEMIPLAEENYRKFRMDRAAYALNTYINQAREIANDMRSVQDFEAHASKISDMVRDHFAQVARNLVDETYALKKNIRDENNPKARRIIEEKIDATTRSHGRFMNETVKALENKITSFLVEKPDNAKVGRAAHGTKRNNPNG